MKTIIGIIWFVLVAAIRVVLWIIGWFVVAISLIGDGKYHTWKMWKLWADAAATPAAYSTSRWKMYVWWAWRNPTPGWIGKWKQPMLEGRPNPDELVRTTNISASRWMLYEARYFVYWEYWYMRRFNHGKYNWFEFRIGWKFVDGNEEFFPTFQLGPRSS
jgi:hypothetical protein